MLPEEMSDKKLLDLYSLSCEKITEFQYIFNHALREEILYRMDKKKVYPLHNRKG